VKTWLMGAYVILFAGASILISLIPCLCIAVVIYVSDLFRRKR
jgi:hypothetical protein